MDNVPIILVLGPPGAGKGTMCKRIAQDIGLWHLSVGDFLRGLAHDRSTPLTKDRVIRDCLAAGELLPGSFLMPLLREHIGAKGTSGSKGILLDGFPRSLQQQYHLDIECPKLALVVHVHCPKEVARVRYLGRKNNDRPGEDESLFAKRYEKHEINSPSIMAAYHESVRVIKVDTSGDFEEYIDRVKKEITSTLSDEKTK